MPRVVLFFIFYLEVERAEPRGMYTVVAQLKALVTGQSRGWECFGHLRQEFLG